MRANWCKIGEICGFPMDRRGSCELVMRLLVTQQTILTCLEIVCCVANKSATSWQQVVVMEVGKRHNTTDNGLLLTPTCYAVYGVALTISSHTLILVFSAVQIKLCYGGLSLLYYNG